MNTIQVESSQNTSISSLLTLCDTNLRVYDLSTGLSYVNENSTWIVISKLSLGNTPTQAFQGDRGLVAYDHSLIDGENPHNMNASQVPSTFIAKPIGSTGTANILGDTYNTVIMPDGKEWLSENLTYVGEGTVGRWWSNAASNDGTGRYYLNTESKTIELLLLNGWHLPSVSEATNLLTIVSYNPTVLTKSTYGGTDIYGFGMLLCGTANYEGGWQSRNEIGKLILSGSPNKAFYAGISSAGIGTYSTERYNIRLVRDVPSTNNVQEDINVLYNTKAELSDIPVADLTSITNDVEYSESSANLLYEPLFWQSGVVTTLEYENRISDVTGYTLTGDYTVDYLAGVEIPFDGLGFIEIYGDYDDSSSYTPELYLRDDDNYVELEIRNYENPLPNHTLFVEVPTKIFTVKICRLSASELSLEINKTSYVVSRYSDPANISNIINVGFKSDGNGVHVKRIDQIT